MLIANYHFILALSPLPSQLLTFTLDDAFTPKRNGMLTISRLLEVSMLLRPFLNAFLEAQLSSALLGVLRRDRLCLLIAAKRF